MQTEKANDQYMNIMDLIEEREQKVEDTLIRNTDIKLSEERQQVLDARQKQLDDLVKNLQQDIIEDESIDKMENLANGTDEFLNELDDILKGFK